MVFNYNLNESELPWIYKKTEYANKTFPSFGGFNLPMVTIGSKYYTNIKEIGWTCVIIKSLVCACNDSFVIVYAPNGKEYALPFCAEFFRTKEDALERASYNSTSSYIANAPKKRYMNNANIMNSYSILPFKKEYAFKGYVYKSNVAQSFTFNIKYLWIDKDGLHYQLETPYEQFYETADECLSENFKILDFDDNSTMNSKPLKKITLMVEVYAEDLEQAKLKVKIE